MENDGTNNYNIHYNYLDAINGEVIEVCARMVKKSSVKTGTKTHGKQYTTLKGDAFCFIAKPYRYKKSDFEKKAIK